MANLFYKNTWDTKYGFFPTTSF